MTEPRWLPLNFILEIHSAQIAEHGGADGVRDAGLLESAMARPVNAYAYGIGDICELAALYCVGIIQNHPFVDDLVPFDGIPNPLLPKPVFFTTR